MNVAQMSDTIETRIVIDNNTKEEYSYSVKEYASELLSKSNEYPAETVKLVKALLNYGAAAQTFFKYNTDKPANGILSDADKTVDAADFDAYNSDRNDHIWYVDGDDSIDWSATVSVCQSYRIFPAVLWHACKCRAYPGDRRVSCGSDRWREENSGTDTEILQKKTEKSRAERCKILVYFY